MAIVDYLSTDILAVLGFDSTNSFQIGMEAPQVCFHFTVSRARTKKAVRSIYSGLR